ncbi:MAG: tetratricopeptide repeat protein [Vicinamibacterales bacterium]
MTAPASGAPDSRQTLAPPGTRFAERRHSPEPRWRVAILAAVMLGVEGGLYVFAHRHPDALIASLSLHVIVVAALSLSIRLTTFAPERLAVLLLIATCAFGPLGPAGVLLTIALGVFYERYSTALEEWHRMLFPEVVVDPRAELWRRIGQRASDRPPDQNVTPFLDILSFGSIPQKQAVISLITQQFHPAFAPALRAALNDGHNVIRVQAATAIARLENDVLASTFALEAKRKDEPDDARHLLALAEHYDDHAFTGLLDPVRERDSRDKAVLHYRAYLAQEPGDQPTTLRLARLLLRQGAFAEAESLLARLVGDPASGDARGGTLAPAAPTDAAMWLMEALFHQRRFSDLRALAAHVTRSTHGASTWPTEMAPTLAMWGGGAAEPGQTGDVASETAA